MTALVTDADAKKAGDIWLDHEATPGYTPKGGYFVPETQIRHLLDQLAPDLHARWATATNAAWVEALTELLALRSDGALRSGVEQLLAIVAASIPVGQARRWPVMGVALDGAHDAGHDAVAAARLAWKQARTYPELAGMGLDELAAAQAGWYAEWATEFRRYLIDRGRTDDLPDEAWPVRPIPIPIATSPGGPF